MKYLLAVTIGPVQAFIEESRKLSDLFNSSNIISQLMKRFYELIKESDSSTEFIYPDYNNLKNDINYSNYILLELEKIIDLKDIESKVYCLYGKENQEILKENFHVFWAFEEFNENYKESYNKLAKFIGDLKNTYEFEQSIQESGIKCSLCGKRNIKKINFKEAKNYKLQEDEQLCKLCLLKRRDSKNMASKFRSVYSISVFNWLKENKDVFKKDILENMEKIFVCKDKYFNINEINSLIKRIETFKNLSKNKKNEINSELKNEYRIDESKTDEIVENLNDLKRSLDKVYINIREPEYEYAFVKFDVDDLGKWMSGEYLGDEEDLLKFQKSLSKVMLYFGQKLKKDLENHYKGVDSIIYCGGDDFLGIVPKEDINFLATKVEQLFKKLVKEKIEEFEVNKSISYSICITIAQCKDSMSYALRRTNTELENVKNRFRDKDGVVINYIINNGKEVTYYLTKNIFSKLFKIIGTSKNIKEKSSFSYIRSLQKEFSSFDLDNMSKDNMETIKNIIGLESIRLMNRAIKDENQYVEIISDFFFENIEKCSYGDNRIDLVNSINALRIIEYFSKINFRGIE